MTHRGSDGGGVTPDGGVGDPDLLPLNPMRIFEDPPIMARQGVHGPLPRLFISNLRDVYARHAGPPLTTCRPSATAAGDGNGPVPRFPAGNSPIRDGNGTKLLPARI